MFLSDLNKFTFYCPNVRTKLILPIDFTVDRGYNLYMEHNSTYRKEHTYAASEHRILRIHIKLYRRLQE